MAETTIKGLEQARAKFAYDCAKRIAGGDSKKAKEYKSYAKKLPMMIKTNGLGAAIAFAFSKGKDGNAWELLFNHVQDWLRQEQKKWLLGSFSAQSLENAVISLNSNEYHALTVEVLAFLNWLRRFAEGLIVGEAEEE